MHIRNLPRKAMQLPRHQWYLCKLPLRDFGFFHGSESGGPQFFLGHPSRFPLIPNEDTPPIPPPHEPEDRLNTQSQQVDARGYPMSRLEPARVHSRFSKVFAQTPLEIRNLLAANDLSPFSLIDKARKWNGHARTRPFRRAYLGALRP